MKCIFHVHIFVIPVLKISQLANDLWKWTPIPETCLLYYSFVNAKARWRSELTPSPGTEGREREAGNSKGGRGKWKGSSQNIFFWYIASSYVHRKDLTEAIFYVEPAVQSYIVQLQAQNKKYFRYPPGGRRGNLIYIKRCLFGEFSLERKIRQQCHCKK